MVLKSVTSCSWFETRVKFSIFKSHGLDIKEQWICVEVKDELVPLF